MIFLSFIVGLALPLLMGATTDQIFNAVYDSSNTALKVNVVAGSAGGGLTIGTTTITSGTNGRILYDNSGVLGELTIPLSVANGGTALASGTSGGILGYTASGTLASSAALTANTLIKGGGAGATPVVSAITDDGAGALGFYPAAAAPQAVTVTYASVVTGTTDTAGAATTTKLSGSTGSGVGGTWSIQNTNKAGTGNTPNTYGNVLTLSPPNTGTTAPVNYVDIKNAITGSGPTIAATGSDSAVALTINPKGTGDLTMGNTGGNVIINQNGGNTDTILGSDTAFGAASGSDRGAFYSRAGIRLGFHTGATLGWTNSASDSSGTLDTILRRGGAAATLQLGTDSNTETDQTIKALSAASGNNSGSDLILTGGLKAGSGQDGAVVLGKGYAIGNLPTGRPEGSRAWVTDQVTACPAIGTAPTAGGAIRCPVFFDGTNWVGG